MHAAGQRPVHLTAGFKTDTFLRRMRRNCRCMQNKASRRPRAGSLKGGERAFIGHDGVHDGGISNARGDGSLGCDCVGDTAERPCSRYTAAECLLQPHAATEGCRYADGPTAICACTNARRASKNDENVMAMRFCVTVAEGRDS